MIETNSCPSQHIGEFIKPCPCSPQTISCGYHNINLHTGCPYDCSYCILQLYLQNKQPHFFNNLPDAARHLETISKSVPFLRVGSGELADSLADPRTDQIIPFIFKTMADFPNVIFEFKTKSARITPLLSHPAPANIVVAWSLNPQEIITQEEHLTASLKDRLQAISALIDKGYRVAVHFDPLIITANWQILYRELVDQIARILPVSRLAWWSLGALRFPAELRSHIFAHPESRLFDGELIKGYDGKYRYLRPLRQHLFATVRTYIIKRFGSECPLYLCMEDEEMWRAVFPGFTPESTAINRRLYEWTMALPAI